jgi:hypothetical protein
VEGAEPNKHTLSDLQLQAKVGEGNLTRPRAPDGVHNGIVESSAKADIYPALETEREGAFLTCLLGGGPSPW